MKQARFLGFLPAFCLLAIAPAVYAGDRALRLSDESEQFGAIAGVALTLDSDADVEGLVATGDWDGSVGTGVGVVPGAAIAGAEILESRIEADYFVLGVVIDINGSGPSAIPSGTGIDVATVEIQCGDAPGATPIEFRDGTYSMVDGGPALDNIIVVGGLSIGPSDGLGLDGGSLECTPPPPRIVASDGSNPSNGEDRCGTARVLIDNPDPVEGLVVVVCHGAGLSLSGVELGSAAAAADFFETEEDASAGYTAGVVIDLVEPFVAEFAIPAGSGQHVLTASYCCPPQARDSNDLSFALDLCDGVLGDPLKDNILVVGGRSIGVSDGLVLVDGRFTCNAPVGLEVAPTQFLCSGRDGADLVAARGGSVEVCFAVRTLEDNNVGHAQPDHIQGFSMAISFCDELTCRENLDITGTILDALNADFVSIQCDNDRSDGDGNELIIGVLIDALPPFTGDTIAPSPDPQPIGYVTFDVSDDAVCGDVCPIEFVEGLNGRGRVPIKNLVSAENHSRTPTLTGCVVSFVDLERFFRGDCNFSLMGSMSVDIADAAAVVSHLFLPGSWRFNPGCLDACDCNDDGRVDLADSVCILQYLFQGGRTPPAPGPGWDPDTQTVVNADDNGNPTAGDPTEDKLDCMLGSACVLVAH